MRRLMRSYLFSRDPSVVDSVRYDNAQKQESAGLVHHLRLYLPIFLRNQFDDV